jgi:threonine aldolase
MTMDDQIELRSDNAAGVAPEILAAITAANTGSALAYGADEWTARLRDQVRDVFEHPHAEVFPVISGTAANSLALAAMCPPWGAVLCHETAHIIVNECGGTSMYGGGAIMRGVGGEQYRIDPKLLEDAFADTRWGDPHQSQPRVLSLTLPTDHGTVYSPAQVRELTTMAAVRGMRAHIDGARLANALVTLDCSPAELTWKSGVHAFSLGAMKNGAITDAIVSFDASISDELLYRTKRAGHTASKMRFQSAQLIAYLTDGLWLRLAAHSNAAMSRLAEGLRKLDVEFMNEPEVNMLFLRVDPGVADRMAASGLLFYREAPDVVRLVTSFETTDDDVDIALARIETALTT